MPSFAFSRLNLFDNTELFSSENENAYFPFHFHDIFCISLITRGTELLNNTEQEFIAPAGTISVTQATEVHRNYSLDKEGYSYRTIYVNPDILRFFNKGKQVQFLERVIDDPGLFHDLHLLFNSSVQNPGALENCFKKIAVYATAFTQKRNWQNTFYRIDEIIEEHAGRPIEAEWLARQFCMSKFHFIREFKKAKGVPPQTYITLYRLGKAKKMLLQNIPLRDIAYLNGFCDPSHFTNSFKKFYGITPSLYGTT